MAVQQVKVSFNQSKQSDTDNAEIQRYLKSIFVLSARIFDCSSGSEHLCINLFKDPSSEVSMLRVEGGDDENWRKFSEVLHTWSYTSRQPNQPTPLQFYLTIPMLGTSNGSWWLL